MKTQAQIVAELVRGLSDEALAVLADLTQAAVYDEGLGEVDEAIVVEIAAMVDCIPVEAEG